MNQFASPLQTSGAPLERDGGGRPRSDAHGRARLPRRQGARCARRRPPPGMSETLAPLRQGLSRRPARSAAEHVPGLRLAARRPAHAAHRDRAVRLGLLRLRPDLHLAFLRRAPHRRLRAVQLGDARHRQAVRGHPRSPCSSSPIPTNTTRSSSSICACRPPRACRCDCCPRRSTACASSASTCRASACRPTPRPRTCSPARCCAYARLEAEQGPVQAPRVAARARSRRFRCSARCFRPTRCRSAACSISRASPPARSCRRANGASSTARSIAPRSRRSIRSIPPACASSRPRAARSSARRRSAMTARPPGSRRSARPARVAPRKVEAAKNRLLPAIRGALARDADQGPHHALGLRRLGAARRAPAGRERRRSALRRHGVPAHALLARLTATGSRRKRRACPISRLARAGPRRARRIQARSRDRHDAGRAEGQAECDPGALFHQPDFGASADGRRRRRLARQGRSTRRWRAKAASTK